MQRKGSAIWQGEPPTRHRSPSILLGKFFRRGRVVADPPIPAPGMIGCNSQ